MHVHTQQAAHCIPLSLSHQIIINAQVTRIYRSPLDAIISNPQPPAAVAAVVKSASSTKCKRCTHQLCLRLGLRGSGKEHGGHSAKRRRVSVLLFACVAVIALASGTSLRVMLASFGKFHEALHNQSVAEMYAEMGERATQAYEKSKGMASTAAKVYSEAKSTSSFTSWTTASMYGADGATSWAGTIAAHAFPMSYNTSAGASLSNATNETLDNEITESLEALFGGGGNGGGGGGDAFSNPLNMAEDTKMLVTSSTPPASTSSSNTTSSTAIATNNKTIANATALLKAAAPPPPFPPPTVSCTPLNKFDFQIEACDGACNAASAKFHCRLCKCKTCGFCAAANATAAAKPVAATSPANNNASKPLGRGRGAAGRGAGRGRGKGRGA